MPKSVPFYYKLGRSKKGLHPGTHGHTALLDVGHKPLGFTAFFFFFFLGGGGGRVKAAFPHSSLVHACINGSYEIVLCLSLYNTIFSSSGESY